MLVAIALNLAPAAFAASAPKVTVCHRAPGNPGKFEKIAVGRPAVAAHLAHGDALVATCDSSMANCGSVSDDCGGVLDCGTCAAPETCGGGGTPNQCGCTPTTTCAEAGAACGSVDDGCGLLDCGTCPAGESCVGTLCLPGCDAVTEPHFVDTCQRGLPGEDSLCEALGATRPGTCQRFNVETTFGIPGCNSQEIPCGPDPGAVCDGIIADYEAAYPGHSAIGIVVFP